MSQAQTVRQYLDTANRYLRESRLTDAEQYYRAVLTAAPAQLEALYGVGLVCLRTGRFDEAIYRFDQVLTARPDHSAARLGLGDALTACGRQQDAVAQYRHLIEAEPNHAAAHYALGQASKQLGAFNQAREAFTRAVALSPDNPRFHFALAETTPFVEGDTRLVALEALARHSARYSGIERVELHFALFKAYDDLKRPAEAFSHLTEGNHIYRAMVPYEEARVLTLFSDLKKIYNTDVMAAYRNAGHASNVPVFVVGMPRSGTSLVEQILASHPDVYGAGELLFVQDLILGGFAGLDYPAGLATLGADGLKCFGGYYAVRLTALAPKARRIVDKLPANFRHIGLLHLALPNAKIIQVHRNARDTCFSCYTQLFANGLNYAYDLTELGHYSKAAEDLMKHWSATLPEGALLDIQYETLVRNFEATARQLVEFCGLEWDERCLKFYETKRAVRTKSEFQVRQPIYTNSIGRWQVYEPWLAPLFEALA